jgi:hypothetical protein
VSEQEAQRKYALECLRMKAECMQLAGDAATPELQRHFLDQADVWAEMAERGLEGKPHITPPADPDTSD